MLGEGLARYGAQLHAYCLMTNHVHLLLTPLAVDSIPRILQHLGRMYVRYINKTYRRSGTLWERFLLLQNRHTLHPVNKGRYKASLIDAKKYLLACYRYIELNPATAAMVEKPEEYRWSSFHFNAVGTSDPLVTPHAVYFALANDDSLRQYYYRELFQVNLSEHNVHSIRACLTANQVLGAGKFKEQIEATLNRKLGYVQRGRPVYKEVIC